MKLTDEEINDIKTMYGTGHPLVKKLLCECSESRAIINKAYNKFEYIKGLTMDASKNNAFRYMSLIGRCSIDGIDKTKGYK